mmetsp:Transcript_96170/g.170706  ORF Transcript_96170/g.170706 Transcript_96170/m.170706 type:complete len:458 (+) Transcript_96170:71-1444(+)
MVPDSPDGPLPDAGKEMHLQASPSRQGDLARFPATAFDSNWVLKKAVSLPELHKKRKKVARFAESEPARPHEISLPSLAGRAEKTLKAQDATASVQKKATDVSGDTSPASSDFQPVRFQPFRLHARAAGNAAAEKATKGKGKGHLPDLKAAKSKQSASLPSLTKQPKQGNPTARRGSAKRGSLVTWERRAVTPDLSTLKKNPALEEEEEEAKKRASRVPLQTFAAEHGVPMDIATKALDVYFAHASVPQELRAHLTPAAIKGGKGFCCDDLGHMDNDQFGMACCDIAGIKSLDNLPEEFLNHAMRAADKDNSGCIEFDEFLHFFHSFSFSEEFSLGDSDRALRSIARHHGLSYKDLDFYKAEFDKVDEDRSGFIEFSEFKKLITRLMKIPKGQDLPESRLKELWRDAKRKSTAKDSPDLDFDGFVGFYKRYSSDRLMPGQAPFEIFYANVRPGASAY